MTENKTCRLVFDFISASLALLFTYTALSKLLDVSTFRQQMLNQPFPEWFANLLSWVLPFAEIAIATLLLNSKTRLTGLYLSLVFMSMFTLYIALVLLNIFGRIPCSCGGIFEKMSWEMHLLFNIIFVLLALTGIFIKEKQGKPKTWKTE